MDGSYHEVGHEKRRSFLHESTSTTADSLKAFTCDFHLLNATSLHRLTLLENLRTIFHFHTLVMANFTVNIGPDGVTQYGPNGWTHVGPDGVVSTSTNGSNKNNTSSTDNYTTKNKIKQSKKYYCKPILHFHFLLLTSNHVW